MPYPFIQGKGRLVKLGAGGNAQADWRAPLQLARKPIPSYTDSSPKVPKERIGGSYMTLTLELPAELEKELAAAAQQAGLSLAEYSLQLLAMHSRSEAGVTTGADLVAYWQSRGLIGMRLDIQDSQAHAQEVRSKAGHRLTEA